jgi:CubicO group peptidase (beta-lactamase class C family)
MRNAVIVAVSVAAVVMLLVVVAWLRPPELIRVGAGYTAKIVCSNVFLAGRDGEAVLQTDVQAPGNPLLRLMRVSVDPVRGEVRAGLFGFIGGGLAVFRRDTGCTVLPDGKLDAGADNSAGLRDAVGRTPVAVVSDGAAASERAAAHADVPWPEGDGALVDPSLVPILADDNLAGPGMRAIVVVHAGHLVAERYADGFEPQIPELGWSMTKSVTAALIGILVKDGRITTDQSVGLFLHWPPGDPRAKITIADLLAMSSGLHFNEAYGAVSDVTRMLYLEPDMAAFASAQPLEHPIGAMWSYSSGSAVLLSRIFQTAAGADALAIVRQRLFRPLGMMSAVMETDEQGTLVGSSYMYATPRDWARFGLLLADDGVWQGQEILPHGYVAMMASPAPASGGEYGRGLVWRWAIHDDTPGVNPDAAFGIPADAFWMLGHDGQSVTIIPSLALVIVRLGLTPSRDNYHPEPLVRAVMNALK